MLPIRSAALSIALVVFGGFYISAAYAKNGPPAHSEHRPAEPVDINRATVEQLMQVPGITRVWAERIVRFRPYQTKRDLLDNGVISASVYSRIKDSVIAHRPKP